MLTFPLPYIQIHVINQGNSGESEQFWEPILSPEKKFKCSPVTGGFEQIYSHTQSNLKNVCLVSAVFHMRDAEET